MKSIEQIAKEFQEVVDINGCFGGDNDHLFYREIWGYYNDVYLFVIFIKTKNDVSFVRISDTTDNVDLIVSLIRNIEPQTTIKMNKLITKEEVRIETITL